MAKFRRTEPIEDRDLRERQISNNRELQREARKAGDKDLERASTQRMDRALDNYGWDERVRRGL